MIFTEEQLKRFAAPLSQTEDEKCKHAIEMVRDALKNLGFTDDSKMITPIYTDTYSYSLEMRTTDYSRKIKLFIQGSYANNTNVRTESDVDIAVVQEEVFQTEYRIGGQYPQTKDNYGFVTISPASKSFKDEVEDCLKRKFITGVERKNKSIKVHGNTARKDADTVPCRRYRDYRNDYINDANNFIGGIVIRADDGEVIINYPEQHIANGRKKNVDTNHYYKKMVRIIKNLKIQMSINGYKSADEVSSFGLESLLWNIPNSEFMRYSTYKYIFEDIVNYVHVNKAQLSTYKEANGIKDLCPSYLDVQKYNNFISDLKDFYKYN